MAAGPLLGVTPVKLSNEDFISTFREWRALWKPSDQEMDAHVAYISRLAAMMGPEPLCKLTKAMAKNFELEMHMHSSHERHCDVMQAAIMLDAFLAHLRTRRRGSR